MRFPSRQKLLLADGARVRNFSAKDKLPEMIPDRSDSLFARNKLILFFFPLSPSVSSYSLPSFTLLFQNIFFIRSLLFFAQTPRSLKEDSILPIPSFVRCSFANGRRKRITNVGSANGKFILDTRCCVELRNRIKRSYASHRAMLFYGALMDNRANKSNPVKFKFEFQVNFSTRYGALEIGDRKQSKA